MIIIMFNGTSRTTNTIGEVGMISQVIVRITILIFNVKVAKETNDSQNTSYDNLNYRNQFHNCNIKVNSKDHNIVCIIFFIYCILVKVL
jgi:hypothetical protein